jgi:hypothetical protein
MATLQYARVRRISNGYPRQSKFPRAKPLQYAAFLNLWLVPCSPKIKLKEASPWLFFGVLGYVFQKFVKEMYIRFRFGRSVGACRGVIGTCLSCG